MKHIKSILLFFGLIFCIEGNSQIILSEIQDTVGKGYVPITDYDPALATYIQKYMLLQDYLRDSISWGGITALNLNQVLTNGNDAGGLDAMNFAEVEADEFIGDLRGAVLFKAQAGENLAKGEVVYVSGISGNTTIVSKADADDAAKMPAFGVVAVAANSGNPVDIYTFGTLSNLNTSGFTLGDILYVSTTAGQLTATPPTGESALLQNIAKVTRVDNSAGSIKISGAGRTNATPNLNTGRLFVGNASNQAVADGTMYVDIANSRVGINTSSPDKTLVVSDAGSEIVINDTDDTPLLRFRNSGTTSGTVEMTSGQDMRFLTGGTSEAMRITSAGDIGIGTSSPDSKLEIQDGYSHTDLSGLSGASGRAALLTTISSDNDLVTWSVSSDGVGVADKFSMYSNDISAAIFRLSYDQNSWLNAGGGNLGIGLINPSAKLDVNGDVEIATVNTDNTTDDVLVHSSDGTVSKRTLTSIGDEIDLNLGDDNLTVSSGVRTLDISSATRFNIEGSTKKFTVDSDGRVGVNYEFPQVPLHVKAIDNSFADAIKLQQFGSSGVAELDIMHTQGQTVFTPLTIGQNASGNSYIINNSVTSGADLILRNSSDGSIFLQTGGANTRVSINNTGKVGIGLGNSSYGLHQYSATGGTQTVFESGAGSGGAYSTTHAELVVDSGEGNMGIQLMGTTTSNQRILFGDTGANARGWLEYEHDILTGEGMKFGVVGSTAMVIDDNQNVGIGTDTPATNLEVSSTSNTNFRVTDRTPSGGAYLNINTNRGTNQIASSTIGTGFANEPNLANFYFTINGEEYLKFATDYVDGTATVLSRDVIFNEDGLDVDFRVESDTDTHALFVQGSDGNVAIGLSNPSQKLQVAGNIFTTNDGTTRFIRSYSSTGAWSQLTGIGLQTDGSMSIYSNDQRVNPLYLGLPNLEWTNIVNYYSGSALWYDSDGVTSTLVAILNSSGLDLTTVPTENTSDILTWGSTGIISKTTKADIIADAGYWDRTGTTITEANTGDDLNFDSNTLFVDASTNRVGIGTNLPSETLTIYASNGGFLLYDSNNNGNAPYMEVIGKRLADNNTTQAFGGGLALSRITGSQLTTGINLGSIYFGGNHTDGTEGNLLYTASISAESDGSFTNSTTMPTRLVFRTGSTGRALGTPNVDYGIDRMVIDSDGNVGIGTSPSYKLDVNGTANVTGTAGFGTAPTSSSRVKIESSSASIQALEVRQTAAGGGGQFGDDGDGNLGTTDDGYFKYQSIEGFTPNLVFQDISGSTNPMYITVNSNDMYIGQVYQNLAGNTRPQSAIIIDGDYVSGSDTAPSMRIRFPTYGAGTKTGSATYLAGWSSAGQFVEVTAEEIVADGGYWDRNSGSAYTYLANSGDKVGIGIVPTTTFQVDGTGYTNKMIVSEADNIDATTRPGSWLQLTHDTFHGVIGDEHPNPECGILMHNEGSGNEHHWVMYQGVVKDVASTSPSSLRFDIGYAQNLQNISGTPTWSPRFTVRQSGNVGIGTTAPAKQLEIENTGAAATMIIQTTDDYNAYIEYQNNSNGGGLNYRTGVTTLEHWDISSDSQVMLRLDRANNRVQVIDQELRVSSTGSEYVFFNTDNWGMRDEFGNLRIEFDASTSNPLGTTMTTYNNSLYWVFDSYTNDYMLTTGSMDNIKFEKTTGTIGEYFELGFDELKVYSETDFFTLTKVDHTGGFPETASFEFTDGGYIRTGGGIVHLNDEDTYMGFNDDEIFLYAGGETFMTLDETTQNLLHINPTNSDIDVRMGSQSLTNAFFLRGSDGKIGINTNSPSFTLHVNGQIGIASDLVHVGDTNTKIGYDADNITFTAGGVNLLELVEGAQDEVVVNEDRANVDFRVESQTNENLLLADASANSVAVLGDFSVDTDVFTVDETTDNISMVSPSVTVGDNSQIELVSNIGYNTIEFNGGSLRFSNGTTEHLNILSDGDLDWSGRAVGELFSNSDNTTSGTYSKIDFTVEVLDLGDATPSTANDDIELTSVGYYNVEIVGFFWNNGDSSTECEVALFRDTTEEASVAPIGSKFTNIIYKSPDPTTLMTTKLMSINGGDNLSVQFKRVSGTGTCHCEDVRLHVSRVGLLD